MNTARALRLTFAGVLCLGLAACGGAGDRKSESYIDRQLNADARKSSIWDLFDRSANPNNTVAVNRYLWNASLDVLNFLPIQSVDPFTGVIQTGYGTPPGGGRAYRATIKISDPAMDARSLKLSLQGQGGAAVAPGTVRAVEDAIMTRARQLRIQDGRL